MHLRTFTVAALASIAIAGAAIGPSAAQQGDAPKGKAKVADKSKPAAGMKTCTYKFPDGEKRSWTCRKEEPCCAWDAIKYVKCGSTVTNCL